MAITVLKLLNIINKFKKSIWIIEEPKDIIIDEFLHKSGVYKLFKAKNVNKGLFSQESTLDIETPIIQQSHNGIYTTSFPLITLDFKKFEYRVCVEDFIDKMIGILEPFCKVYNIKINLFLKLLKEIAKNSEDHTSESAIFGFDISENRVTKKGTILFSFCDEGIGIHGNIKKNIESDGRYRENVSSKMSIADSYHYAYTPGFTTSRSKINKGIGMSMILDCVKLLGLHLTIYDAKSMGFIPRSDTHDEIRKNFWNTGNAVGFYYYGELDIK